MPRRATTPLVVLLLASPGLLAQAAPTSAGQMPASIAQHTISESDVNAIPAPPATAAAKPVAKDPKDSRSHVLFFYTAPRSTVEMEVHDVPQTNEARLDRLRAAFHSADCNGERMQEQAVHDKHGEKGTNLLCIWPGEPEAGTIVVAAHYEHEGKGEGALAGWSGAALLPFLYKAIQGQPRENTFVFLESWKNDGVQGWLKSIPRDERKRIRAMIDLDALGMGNTRYFTTFGFLETPPPGAEHLQTELLWAAIDDGLTQPPEETNPHRWLAFDPTDPFRAFMIPTIVIHSVPLQLDHVPGSASDIASAVDGNAYFQSYHLICTFLASLDHMAKKLALNDPFWKAVPGKDERPDDENPRITFRNVGGWRTTH